MGIVLEQDRPCPPSRLRCCRSQRSTLAQTHRITASNWRATTLQDEKRSQRITAWVRHDGSGVLRAPVGSLQVAGGAFGAGQTIVPPSTGSRSIAAHDGPWEQRHDRNVPGARHRLDYRRRSRSRGILLDGGSLPEGDRCRSGSADRLRPAVASDCGGRRTVGAGIDTLVTAEPAVARTAAERCASSVPSCDGASRKDRRRTRHRTGRDRHDPAWHDIRIRREQHAPGKVRVRPSCRHELPLAHDRRIKRPAASGGGSRTRPPPPATGCARRSPPPTPARPTAQNPIAHRPASRGFVLPRLSYASRRPKFSGKKHVSFREE